MPYPPYRGDKLKIYNLAKRLKDKHRLYLLTFAQTEEDLTYKAELEKIFYSVQFVYLPKWKSALNCLPGIFNKVPFQVLYFKSQEMKEALDNLMKNEHLDAVHVQHIRMSPYLKDKQDIPRILDLPDAFSLYWERRKSIKRGFLQGIFENEEQRRVFNFEQVLNEYDMSLVCSKEDMNYLQEKHGINNLNILPNGVDMSTFKAEVHDYSHNNTLLFTGNMDYAPNVDAVQYFVNDIFPEIKKEVPNVKFIIAGQRPVKKVLELANDDILVTGFVKDLAAMYNKASVVVAPLRFGAGTQNKVLEAMSMGIPVVCSNIGFGGLGINSGEGAIMQTEPDKFASAVIELLLSAAKREQVGIMGKKVITEKFDWDVIAKQLENYFNNIVEQRR